MYIEVVRTSNNMLSRRTWRFLVATGGYVEFRVVLQRYSEDSRKNSRVRNWVAERQYHRLDSEARGLLASQQIKEPPPVPEDVVRELREKIASKIHFDFN